MPHCLEPGSNVLGKVVDTVWAHLHPYVSFLPGSAPGYSKHGMVSVGKTRRLLDNLDLTIWTHPPRADWLAPICQRAMQGSGV